MNPAKLLFNKTHEWVQLSEQDGQQTAIVGLSAFAVEALTDLVFIELPEVGRSLNVGDALGEVESVKAVSDLYSPATGEVCDVNAALSDNLDTLSNDPYGAGWLVKIRVTDTGSLKGLMDYEAYQQQCAEEES